MMRAVQQGTLLLSIAVCSQVCRAQEFSPAVLDGMLPVDAHKMEIMEIAAKAAESAYAGGFDLNLLDPMVRIAVPREDGDGDLDACVIHTTDDYCFAGWQGTGTNAEDWLQNRPTGTSSAVSNTNETKACVVSEGFFEGYNNTKRLEIEAAIDECMMPFQLEMIDPETNETEVVMKERQLVLTGHSQGAALALVASIVLEGYDPLVIAFAQPSALKEDCPYINPANNWRVINTIQSLVTMRYDIVPYANRAGGGAFFEDPTGPSLTLPPAEPNTVDFVGESALYESFYLEKSNPTLPQMSILAHNMGNHRMKMTKLRSLVGENETLSVSGLATGSWCNDDTECSAFNTNFAGGCIFALCRTGELGSVCEWNEQCGSRRCDFTWGGSRICQPKRSTGQGCNEDSDCESNECNWFWRCN